MTLMDKIGTAVLLLVIASSLTMLFYHLQWRIVYILLTIGTIRLLWRYI